MSDQGERGVRWTDMSDDTADHEQNEGTGPVPKIDAKVPEVRVPEVTMPAPTGRTDFSEPEPDRHDVWGKVEGKVEGKVDGKPGTGAEGEAQAQAGVQGWVEGKIEGGGEGRAAWNQGEAPSAPSGPQATPVPQAPSAPSGPQVPPVPSAPQPQVQPNAQSQGQAQPQGQTQAQAGEVASVSQGAAEGDGLPDAEDIKVAPVDAGGRRDGAPGDGAVGSDGAPAWEGSLFDGDGGDADPRYVPAAATGSGSSEPPKPGRPSSGNWQMPDWMADEASADGKLGTARGIDDGGGGRSRLVLVGGIGLLVVALVAAGGVYLMKNKDDTEPAESEGKPDRPVSAPKPRAPKAQLPPDKPLKRFPGRPSKVVGRVADPHSGLAFPRLASPWQAPTKKNKLGTPGWSGQQVMVTEKRGSRLWYGQLLTGTLIPTLRGSYKGPESVKNVTALAAKGFEGMYYAFPHKSAPLASQPLAVDGHKGWLIASYLTYKRPGVKATGELTAAAVIDTGRPTPAVVFASIPNTHRKMWPDLNQFVAKLKVTPS